jgi:hypothetical protein
MNIVTLGSSVPRYFSHFYTMSRFEEIWWRLIWVSYRSECSGPMRTGMNFTQKPLVYLPSRSTECCWHPSPWKRTPDANMLYTQWQKGDNWRFSCVGVERLNVGPFIPVVLQFAENLGRLLMRGLETVFRQFVGLLGRGVGPSQGLCLHRTAQHRKTRTESVPWVGLEPTIPVSKRPRPTP